jgi:hypothetical protein
MGLSLSSGINGVFVVFVIPFFCSTRAASILSSRPHFPSPSAAPKTGVWMDEGLPVYWTPGEAWVCRNGKGTSRIPPRFCRTKNGNQICAKDPIPRTPLGLGGWVVWWGYFASMKTGRFCVCESRFPPLNSFFFRPVASASIPCCASRWKSHCTTPTTIMFNCLAEVPIRSSHMLKALIPKSLIFKSLYCLFRVTASVPMFGENDHTAP